MNRLLLLPYLALLPGFAHADTPQQILAAYQQQAGSASAARGEKFFFAKLTRANGEVVGCASCHTDNPKATGQTRAHKSIEPLAPVANRERFTDPAKVEKWFKRNCKDVLDRECTVQEKADFVAFLIAVK
jgi:hypothetical protein